MRKTTPLVGVALLVALLPGALSSGNTAPGNIPAADPSNPTVTIPPVVPTQASASSEKWDNKLATRRMHGQPGHYQCRQYPTDSKLRQADLVPTGNVSMRITFDQRTGRYEVITVDPRITVSYRVGSHRAKLGQNKPWTRLTDDIYSWTYHRGIEHFGIFILTTTTSGTKEWRGLSPAYDPEVNGVYEMPMPREYGGEASSYLIVASDPTTCAEGNTVPSEVWRTIGLDPR